MKAHGDDPPPTSSLVFIHTIVPSYCPRWCQCRLSPCKGHWSTGPPLTSPPLTLSHTDLQAQVEEEGADICRRRRSGRQQMDAWVAGEGFRPPAGNSGGKGRQRGEEGGRTAGRQGVCGGQRGSEKGRRRI